MEPSKSIDKTIKLLTKNTVSLLRDSVNLLAFSGGSDSSALFCIMTKMQINFDIAIVDYRKRSESKGEIKNATRLAERHSIKCHVLDAPRIQKNFEANARKVRYEFFFKLMEESGYKNLVLAHQLNDRLEWFLMQMCKGGGLSSIFGFKEVETVEKNGMLYNIVRPLLSVTKKDLEIICEENEIKYFIDSSNTDRKYLRNCFRLNFTNEMILNYSAGIRNSFNFLEKDFLLLYKRVIVCNDRNVKYFKSNEAYLNIYVIDRIIKEFGYVISQGQRKYVLDAASGGRGCVIANTVIVSRSANLIYVAKDKNPNAKVKIPKKIRELYRKELIPTKIRKVMFIQDYCWDGLYGKRFQQVHSKSV